MSDPAEFDLPDGNPFLEGDPLAAEPAAADAEGPALDAAAVDEDPLAGAPAADAPKDPVKGVPRKVVEQLRAERRELREALAQRDADLAAAAAEARTAKELAQSLQGIPPERAVWDNRYLNALQALAAKDPAFAQMARQVIAAMEDPSMAQQNSDPNQLPFAPARDTEEAGEEAPARDPRLDAIYEREATSHVKGALDGLAPEFQELFTKLIVGNSDSDPLSLSRNQIRSIAAEYAKENGFKPDQYLAKVKPPTAPAGGARAVPTPGPVGPPRDAEGKPIAAPKSLQEWQASRQARIRALLSPRQ